jgi:hypothetical protein
MARSRLILPRADSKCGKVFFRDRQSADGHRIALEFWNRATNQARQGHRLAVYRCKNCAGFHIGWKRDEIAGSPIRSPELGPGPDVPEKPAQERLIAVGVSQTGAPIQHLLSANR